MTHLVVLGLDNRDDAERATDRVTAALKPNIPSGIQTSLCREREDELVQALQA
jgi:hypothetical protein